MCVAESKSQLQLQKLKLTSFKIFPDRNRHTDRGGMRIKSNEQGQGGKVLYAPELGAKEKRNQLWNIDFGWMSRISFLAANCLTGAKQTTILWLVFKKKPRRSWIAIMFYISMLNMVYIFLDCCVIASGFCYLDLIEFPVITMSLAYGNRSVYI